MSDIGTGSGPAPTGDTAPTGEPGRPGDHVSTEHNAPTGAPGPGAAPRRAPKAIGEPLITARGVSKLFGDFQALKDIDLDIRRGPAVSGPV